MGDIYAQSRQTEQVQDILDQLIKMLQERIVDPLYIAWNCLGLMDL